MIKTIVGKVIETVLGLVVFRLGLGRLVGKHLRGFVVLARRLCEERLRLHPVETVSTALGMIEGATHTSRHAYACRHSASPYKGS